MLNLCKIVLTGMLIFLLSCSQEESGKSGTDSTTVELSALSGEQKFNNYCGPCHWEQMPDKPLAPPVYNIRRRYKMSYPTEETFVNAIVNWVKKPEHDRALLPGALERFNLMPQFPYLEGDVAEIARHLYNADLRPPQGTVEHGGGGRRGMGGPGNGPTADGEE